MKVTVIGGGTGSSAVLNGLKGYDELDIQVIVSMADDGGSNAVLRDEFGLLPLSDLRKSIIALSSYESNDVLREMFTYRFDAGEGLSGHTLGNLMMTALSKISSGEKEAISLLSEIFQVKGKILPVTYQDYRLMARYTDDTVLKGEHLIDEPDVAEGIFIEEFWTDPIVEADVDALRAIKESDFIVVGPGDIYTTTLSSVIVKGMISAIEESDAKVIYVSNLMSKAGQTRHLTQSQILEILLKYFKGGFDYIFINTEELPQKISDYYSDSGEHVLEDDLPMDDKSIIRSDLVADEIFQRDSGDILVRSIVRHDVSKLAWELYRLMKEESFDTLK